MARLTITLSDETHRRMKVAPDRSRFSAPDPGDQHLWDMLAAMPEAVLVSGDRRLLESSDYPGRALEPREFVDRYLAEPS